MFAFNFGFLEILSNIFSDCALILVLFHSIMCLVTDVISLFYSKMMVT